jgi:hypothetical protein
MNWINVARDIILWRILVTALCFLNAEEYTDQISFTSIPFSYVIREFLLRLHSPLSHIDVPVFQSSLCFVTGECMCPLLLTLLFIFH